MAFRPRSASAPHRTCRLVALTYAGALALTLAGCGPTVPTRPTAEAPVAGAEVQALRAEGRFEEAAATYLELAAAQPQQHDYFVLRAVDAALDAGDLSRAATLFDTVADPRFVDGASGRTMATYDLAACRLALASKDTTTAAEALGRVSLTDLPADLGATYWRAEARIARSQGNVAGTILARLELDRALAPASPERGRNAEALWNALTAASPQDLEALGGNDDALAGWFELLQTTRLDLGAPDRLAEAFTDFERRRPGHPANLGLTDRIVERARELLARPQRIALLLPLETPGLTAAAGAVRDGFLAAYLGDTSSQRPARVQVYPVTPGAAAASYASAVADGADFIVGPLTKDAIRNLVAESDFTVPVLALNHIEPGKALVATSAAATPAPLYQFGLPPEQEATMVAESAWRSGYRRALTLAPLDDWGQRVLRAFTSRWSALGGRIEGEARFVDEGPAYGPAVAKVLGVEESRQRAKALEQLLRRNLEFQPQPRDDADFLFLAARPIEARQVMPQVRFFGAMNIPVLATSHVYSGNEADQRDPDLAGIRFTDMPWLIHDSGEPEARAFRTSFKGRHGNQRRLFALGADAYHLANQAARLKATPDAALAGLSGRLSIDRQGYVQREPVWGAFGDVSGGPELAPAGGSYGEADMAL